MPGRDNSRGYHPYYLALGTGPASYSSDQILTADSAYHRVCGDSSSVIPCRKTILVKAVIMQQRYDSGWLYDRLREIRRRESDMIKQVKPRCGTLVRAITISKNCESEVTLPGDQG